MVALKLYFERRLNMSLSRVDMNVVYAIASASASANFRCAALLFRAMHICDDVG